MHTAKPKTIITACLAALALNLAPWPVAAQQILPEINAETMAPVIERLNEVGRDALKRGDTDAAERAYGELLRIQPDNGEALYQMAIFSFQRRDYVRGFELINKAVEIAGDNPFPRLALAKGMAEVGRIDESIREYEYILAHTDKESRAADTASLELNLLKFKLAAQQGERDKVLEYGAFLLREHGSKQSVLENVAFIYGRVGYFAQAKEIYDVLLDSMPKNPLIEFQLANMYESMRETDQAVLHYTQAVSKGKGTDIERQARARLALIEAYGLVQREERALANKKFKEVLELDEFNIPANMNVGIYAQETQDMPAAKQAYQRVIEVQPDNLDARFRLAVVYLDMSNVFGGVRELDLIVARVPNSQIGQAAQDMLARVAQRWKLDVVRQGIADEDQLRQRLMQNPDDSAALAAMGELLMRQQRRDEAKQFFEDAIKLDPNNGDVHFRLGLIYEEGREFERAVASYQMALAIISDENSIKTIRVRLPIATANGHLEKREFKQAEESFRAANELQQNDRAVLWGLAIANAQQGDLEEAVIWYQRFLDLVPDHAGARMNMAFAYEQLEEEEQAIATYNAVALSESAEPGMKKTATERVDYLRRQTNGFSYSLGYSMAFDDNLNSAREQKYFEYRSDLFAAATYKYKLKKGMKLSVNASPAYTTYHRAQFDFFNFTLSPSLLFSKWDMDWDVGLSRNTQSSVLRPELSSTVTDTFNGGVSWVDAERVGYRLFMNYRGFGSEQNSFFDADTLNLGGNINKAGPENIFMGYGYSLTINNNKNTLGNDYAYIGHGLNGRLDKRLDEKLSGYLDGRATLNLYKNNDSSTGFKRQRRTFGFAIGGGVNYRIDEWVSFYADYHYSLQYSNLPVGLIFNELQAVEGRQSTSLGSFTRNSINAGIRMNF